MHISTRTLSLSLRVPPHFPGVARLFPHWLTGVVERAPAALFVRWPTFIAGDLS